jgi:ABC-type multidrug transport system ATPase subunit
MKRRLSLAIAAVGTPKIIFLDEPTTGLDPKVRQQVWTLIEKLKKRKSVVLTTHSMEEADILSDRISILVKGKLKCIGTSMYLKDKYGSGYRIALNVVDGKSEEVMRYIRKLFPEAIQVDSNGGNLLVGVQQYQTLIEFVKMLESREANGLDEYSLKQSIKDWNVSHTTLEEVFMKVTKEQAE